jgi:hypothetical protein
VRELQRGLEPNELVLWVESRRALVVGLRPLLELPVEHVLQTHAGPADRADLERALG